MLVKECRLTLPEIYDLTPRQIEDIYLHPRDEEGNIKMPTAEPKSITPPDDASRLGKLHRVLGMVASGMLKATPEQVADIQRQASALEEYLSGHTG